KLPQSVSERVRRRHGHRMSRRQLAIAGSSLALVTLLAVGAYQFWRQPGRIVSQAELSGAVNRWMDDLTAPNSRWSEVANTKMPASVPKVLPVTRAPLYWRQPGVGGSDGWANSVVALDLVGPNQPRAVLLVIRTSAKFPVPPTPTPGSRLALSGGFT